MNKPAVVATVLLSAIIAVQLGAWISDALAPRGERIESFFKTLGKGSSSDYAVIKDGATGVEATIIVFAFMDNGSVCKDIADYFNRTPSGALPGTYRCEALN